MKNKSVKFLKRMSTGKLHRKRKDDVIRLIDEKGMLTPELKKQILKAEKLTEIEDLYRPFKEKKNACNDGESKRVRAISTLFINISSKRC